MLDDSRLKADVGNDQQYSLSETGRTSPPRAGNVAVVCRLHFSRPVELVDLAVLHLMKRVSLVRSDRLVKLLWLGAKQP